MLETARKRLVAPIPELTQMSWLAGIICSVIVLLALPFILGVGNLFLVSRILVLGIIVTGFNLLWGYTGVLSFGHQAFYGLGAYGFALLSINSGIPTLISIVIASAIGGLAAVVMGVLVLRLRGLFLACCAMAFAQLLWALNLRLGFTGGADGLTISVPPMFLSQTNCYYAVFGMFVASLAILRALTNSPFGLTLKAIRDSERRVEFLGVNAFNYKLAAFSVAGFFTALGGALTALLIRGAYPEMLYWTVAGEFMLACLVGGIGVFLGPVVGAVIFEVVDGLGGRFTVYWPLVIGIILILVVLFFRDGIAGLINAKWQGRAIPKRRGATES